MTTPRTPLLTGLLLVVLSSCTTAPATTAAQVIPTVVQASASTGYEGTPAPWPTEWTPEPSSSAPDPEAPAAPADQGTTAAAPDQATTRAPTSPKTTSPAKPKTTTAAAPKTTAAAPPPPAPKTTAPAGPGSVTVRCYPMTGSMAGWSHGTISFTHPGPFLSTITVNGVSYSDSGNASGSGIGASAKETTPGHGTCSGSVAGITKSASY